MPDRQGLYMVIPPPVYTKGPECEVSADIVKTLPAVFPEILKELELDQNNIVDGFGLLGGNEQEIDMDNYCTMLNDN